MNSPDDMAFFAKNAPAVFANGYTPLPVRPATKVARLPRWQLLCARKLNESELHYFINKHPLDSVAIACGRIIAIDIDSLDEERAEFLQGVAFEILGPTPLCRIGRYPKRAFIYRTADLAPRTQRFSDLDILGDKSYIVAFGEHPNTGRPYYWPDASPLTLHIEQAPAVGNDQIDALVTRLRGGHKCLVQQFAPPVVAAENAPRKIAPVTPAPWLQDRHGLVSDGRDAYLAHLVWKTAQKTPSDVAAIANVAWNEFVVTAELARNRRDGDQPWSHADALAKAKYLVRSGKISRSRPAFSADDAKGFWTPQIKCAFAIKVAQAGSLRRLSPAAVNISNLMLGVVHGSGVCFMSTQRLASESGLAIDTVKKARRHLTQGGFWTRHMAHGGRGRVACYQPDPGIFAADFGTTTGLFLDQTVDAMGIVIPSEERVDWDAIVLLNKKGNNEI